MNAQVDIDPNGTIRALEYLRRNSENLRTRPAGEPLVFGALETRVQGDKYNWDGLKRRIDPAHPMVVFQCTLAGWGAYEEGGVVTKIERGHAMCAIVPSAHRYYLPKAAPSWTFLWVILTHPYVVSRIIETRRQLPAVFPLVAESALFARMVRLLDADIGIGDRFAVEQATFNFLIEFERMAELQLFSAPERDKLLATVRGHVLAQLGHRVDVESLAEAANMSRSHYSHHFKAVVGTAPGAYITQLRLDEAMRLLADGSLKLEAVAAETGFANANHFCKVFRRHFHISPGEFRRQLPMA